MLFQHNLFIVSECSYLQVHLLTQLQRLTRFVSVFKANDYGLFLSDEDPKKGIWLDAGKALDYYMLRNGVSYTKTLKRH